MILLQLSSYYAKLLSEEYMLRLEEEVGHKTAAQTRYKNNIKLLIKITLFSSAHIFQEMFGTNATCGN